MMDGTERRKILRIKGGAGEEVEDLVAVEKRVRISVNGREAVSLYCSPLMIRELAVGLLMTEGVAEGLCTDRMSILYGEEIAVEAHAEGEVRTEGASVTSGCLGGITFRKDLGTGAASDDLRMSAHEIAGLFRKFQARSDLYERTGCVHSAALADHEGILLFAEDIGRHNAVDKVIGAAILEGVSFRGKAMLASGRLSSEIVSKCARWGIPLVASRTAPTALAVGIGEGHGITVVGFVRGDRMNVYSRRERISGPLSPPGTTGP